MTNKALFCCQIQKLSLLRREFFLLVALQKTPSLLGAECKGVGTTPLHANERGQNRRFVADLEPPVYWGISIVDIDSFDKMLH